MKYSEDYWKDVADVTNIIPNIKRLRNKTILITGSTGMVCSAVVELLVYLNKIEKANIHLVLAGRSRQNVLERFQDILTSSEYSFLYFDATQSAELEVNADYIIHGAGNANPPLYADQPVETLLGNIIGTNAMLKVARKNKGSRILYISSSEVYGNRLNDSTRAFQENEYGNINILNPRSSYPNGKRSAETLCISYGAEYNVDSVIVRLGHIYGPTIKPSDVRASAKFAYDAVCGKSIVMKSPGTQLRSYCYTLDCASAILTVLLNGLNGNAYNISNKESIVSIRDMAEALADYTGVEVIYENPSDKEIRGYNLMTNSSLNSEKIEALGWRGLFDLSQGVKKTIDFMRGKTNDK